MKRDKADWPGGTREGALGRKALLSLWQARLERAKTAYEGALQRMDRRDAMYRGSREIDRGANSTFSGPAKKAGVTRNIVAEIIEAQVSSDIPSPKVTPRYRRDEERAALIEDLLRGELDRLPFETINDQDERTTPIQGGDLFLVEWDSGAHTHTTAGGLSVTLLHPKQFIPQPGVHEIRDMDYCFLQLAQTKAYIRAKYGADVAEQGEERPESRSFGAQAVEDMVTQNIAYFRNAVGGIGRISWVNDVLLEYMEDYQARRIKRCVRCGQPMGDTCGYCGGHKYEEAAEQGQPLDEDRRLLGGGLLPARRDIEQVELDGQGELYRDTRTEQTVVPYYKPDVYPIVLRRNVSVFGQFLGDSDVDKIADQQNEVNKIGTKISEKLMMGGSVVTLPQGKQIRRTDEEFKVLEIKDPAEKALIDVLTLQADVSRDMAYQESTYQAARNLIGVTDSFQGRKDTTATSGKAKEFAAAQAAGRLESKRTMKNAAYAELFETMFKFLLAYADEPRPVVSRSADGGEDYAMFDRWDFLEIDDTGEPYWNDEFLFSVDQTAPLAGNREGMWQETRMNLKEGCFGNPQELETLILFWQKMDLLHYPGAKETLAQLKGRAAEQKTEPEAMGGVQHAMPTL